MTTLCLETGKRRLCVNAGAAIDISIPLVFGGEQPNFFGAPRAAGKPLKLDGFVGDTRQGASCNVGEYHLVPHCNGTHTECLGHIVHDELFAPEIMQQAFLPATLISVSPRSASRSRETSLPNPQPTDRLVTAYGLRLALEKFPDTLFHQALIIRTEPNPEQKTQREYLSEDPPPYFSMEAMELLVASGVEHLLVDLPSLDRMNDGGRLTAHRIFWELPPGARDAASSARAHCTVTEMIYVPDVVPDGYYLLNLQMPAFMADAAPSRPLLYPLETK